MNQMMSKIAATTRSGASSGDGRSEVFAVVVSAAAAVRHSIDGPLTDKLQGNAQELRIGQ
jgi:hypothetical protein